MPVKPGQAAAPRRVGPVVGTRLRRNSSHCAIASSAARRRRHNVIREILSLFAAASRVPSFICQSATACFNSIGSRDTASSVTEHSIESTGTHGLYPSLTHSNDASGLDPQPVDPVLNHMAQESKRARISGIRAVVICHHRTCRTRPGPAECALDTAQSIRQGERTPPRPRAPFDPSAHGTSTRLGRVSPARFSAALEGRSRLPTAHRLAKSPHVE